MSAQEQWEARTARARHEESPVSGQAAEDSTHVHSTMQVGSNSSVGRDEDTAPDGAASSERPVGVPRRLDPTDGRFIRAIVIGTAIAGVVAFSISFAALYEVASWLGLPLFMSWAVPVFIDLAILVYAGSVLIHQARGESARASWWALGAFTGLSMIANGAHAMSAQTGSVWQSLVGVTIAVMVPVAVFVATDQLARVAVETPDSRRAEQATQMSEEAEQIRARAELERQRAEVEAELAASRRQIESARREAEREAEVAEARHQRELDRMGREAEAEEVRASTALESTATVSEGQEDTTAPAPAPVKASGAEVTAWIVEQAEAGQAPSAAEIAERFGCSERTGRRRLADAREAHPESFSVEEEQA